MLKLFLITFVLIALGLIGLGVKAFFTKTGNLKGSCGSDCLKEGGCCSDEKKCV